jgi:molybdate transport system ATP-binding protein
MPASPEARLRHHHKLAVQCQVGSLDIDVNLDLHANWTILFGPSGSGKSSLLRAACGLIGSESITFQRLQPDETWRTLQDTNTQTPPHLRSLSWAPQHTSLFPHLTVRENVEFASCYGQSGTTDHQSLVAESLRLFRINHLASRTPQDLSGGERQRVSLARAFATPDCKLMLLDEPFTGIDHTLRNELLPEMRAWLRDRGIPALSVTHDVEEALQLQADVILLREGKIEAEGYVSKVLHAERDRLIRSLNRPH